jgi:excisionase family DNA binding protein
MMNQPGGVLGAQTTPPVQGAQPTGTAPGNQAPAAMELMTPGQAAQVLGVAESDVLASLEAGDLKGKKIGTQWRLTKSAVDQFLNS